MRRLLANLLLAFLFLLYSLSLLGILFVGHAFMVFGIIGFLIMFLVGVLTQGFQKRALRLKGIWYVIVPLFVGLFVTTAILSSGRGVPKMEKASVFATREKYQFSRGEEVSRARFVTVGACFTVAWHLLAIGFSAEQWASLRATIPGRAQPRPPKPRKTSHHAEPR